MLIPGFSAESTLYKSILHYQSLASSGEATGLPLDASVVGFASADCSTSTPRFAPSARADDTTVQRFTPGPACPSGTVCCDWDPESHRCYTCADLNSDPANCGHCGNQCSTSQKCLKGACTGCPDGLAACGNECVDLSNDPQNCQTCGNACPAWPHSTSTCVGGQCGFVCDAGFTPCGNVCCSSTCTGTVAPPARGLSGSSNYIFDSGCRNIPGPYVVLYVGQDLRSDIGFSIQVNASSPAGAEPDAWQQYGFKIVGNSIQGFINNWVNQTTMIVCDAIDLCPTPITNGLPAGYSLALYLTTDDVDNVTGAIYQVYDSNGNQAANQSFSVDQARCNCALPPAYTCTGFQPGDLSPTTALTVEIVGPGGGSAATFSSSGSGVIEYGANALLTPLSSLPACVETPLETAEQSNAVYGTLNGCPQVFMTQQFSFAGCPPGLTSCNGTCKDLTFDSENCGACNHICATNTSCLYGICLCPSEYNCCNRDAAGNCTQCLKPPATCF